jgi:hypothetical protein
MRSPLLLFFSFISIDRDHRSRLQFIVISFVGMYGLPAVLPARHVLWRVWAGRARF